jgi:hypothetical protein
MRRYLYLTHESWAGAWIDGGVVPILPASTYKADVRLGTSTPDENLIHQSPIDIASLRRFGISVQNVKDFTFVGNRCNGIPMPECRNADYYVEDGIILSFSNVASLEIMNRLGKAACVAILDFDNLKCSLDKQLNTIGVADNCGYTADHQRNHFLKGVLDSWQQEYRIFWKIQEPRSVHILPGTAVRVVLE